MFIRSPLINILAALNFAVFIFLIVTYMNLLPGLHPLSYSIDYGAISFKDVTLKFNISQFPEEISKNESAKVVFLIGNGDVLSKEQQKEMDSHRDIISVVTEDNYRNLIFKSALTLHISQVRCPTAFLLKVDEDVVLNIDRFMSGIEHTFFGESSAIYCKTWKGAKPSRDTKKAWFVSEYQFRGRTFPEYCAGPSYVLTSSAVTSLLNSLHNFNLMTVEDVFMTGIVAQGAGVKRISMKSRFKSNYTVELEERSKIKNL